VEAQAVKVMRSTWILAVAAAGAVALVHLDPWLADGAGAGFVSERSAAKRVFTRLAEHDVASARIELEPTGGPSVQLVPGEHEHRLLLDGVDVGPADPEAVNGLWASLRMATTLRAVPDGADVGPQRRGRITLRLPDETLALTIGGATPDGVGLYGTLESDSEAEVWVVESELGEVLAQHPHAWLVRRAVVLDPAEVSRLKFSDLTIERGLDGRWRSTSDGTQALLDSNAVETRLERIAGTWLDPMLPEGEAADPDALVDRSAKPWLEIESTHGRSWTLHLGGPCPGHPQKRVLARGPGWPGCIDEAVTDAWPVPGRDGADAGRLVEPRLAPHPAARVLAIEQTKPERMRLRRSAGDWVVEGGAGGSGTNVPVAEVYRWYQALHDAEVDVDVHASTDIAFDVDLSVETDSTLAMRIRCGRDKERGGWLCRRDEGPVLRVREPSLRPGFDLDTFAPRTIIDLPAGEARAIEILPGPTGATARQSAHLDLGVWRLDAPQHPDGDDALSEVALEGLLAAFSSARAQAWVPAPATRAERIIRVERTPRRGTSNELLMRLHPGCIATVDGRAAQLPQSTCEMLRSDLLHDDPLRHWIETARTLELEADGQTTRLRRERGTLQRTDGQAVSPAVHAELQRLSQLRATAIRQGPPPGEPSLRLRVLPRSGPAFVVEVGEHWAKLEHEDWHYALGNAS
jgi:hypothetical protein